METVAQLSCGNSAALLFECMAGSRAYGTAITGSDADIRGIFVSVVEPRDVIEAMLPGDLDVSGWDLRKALRLFAKCNLALNEWLGSPLVYAERPEFADQLRQLMPRHFNPMAATHHYRSMAQTAFNDDYAGGSIRIKKLFYVLGPLLACRWIERTGSQPPTEFAALVAAQWVTSQEKAWITELLQAKSRAAEAQPVELGTARAEAISIELEHYRQAANLLSAPLRYDLAELDALLRACVWSVSRPRR